ncbi:S41 family peptidase [Polyangium sorediatum]|uniref:S41 family peptidase n=1 Tax=Polyangium sorediatum TaxID=889274 RepID=A0ABT6NUC1_9BACT|nr:S41 family peptidase [Polyangium sorediatum]MDI1431936.1 S41 family peptidase [Polyangium sorediatum]
MAAAFLSIQGCSSDPAAGPGPSDGTPDGGVPDSGLPDGGEPDGSPPAGDCDAQGATRCDDGKVSTCELIGGSLNWSGAAYCPDNQICKGSACEPATEKQQKQAAAVDQYADDLRDYTGYDQGLDFPAMKKEARRILFLGDESDYALAKAVRHVFRGVPQGHTSIGFGPNDWSACMTREANVPLRGTSWYGVCARAAGDASIITFAADNNPMGLKPGDQVVKVTTANGDVWQSPGFLDRIGQEPICDGSLPSKSARDDYAASNLFALLNTGATIDVIASDGTTKTITVPERTANYISCFDALRRPSRTKLFESSQRADGVVVMIVPTLGNHADHPFPQDFTVENYRTWVAEGIDLIRNELLKYSDIKGLVWDIRGNGGGSQELGIALIGSDLLGSTEGAFANCYARVPASDPPAFTTSEVEYPFPYQAFADEPLPSVGFTGKQVLLVDGTAYSAADWMVQAAKKAGVMIVGHASAGAYGYSTGDSYVTKHIAPAEGVHAGILSFISGAHCVDTATGESMEGAAPIDVVVDFKASDLAAGIDTQLEAAAALAK